MFNSPLYVVKLGGSITTIKNGNYELNYENLKNIAEVLSKSKLLSNSKIILVFGGGSFGNVAPIEYNILSKCNKDTYLVNISKMTTVMFSMLTDITNVFIEYGIPVYPFQCSAIVRQKINLKYEINIESILLALKQNYIPIISGDLVFNRENDFTIFSSDNIPFLISEVFPVKHVLYYTDVDGLYSNLIDKKIIPLIKLGDFEAIKNLAGPSSNQDVTGGMAHKIIQIENLLKNNVTSEILSFKNFRLIDHSLNKEIHFGTRFEVN